MAQDKTYSELIESAPLVKGIETYLTTGDIDYRGTAVEIADARGAEIFHIVVSGSGERQVVFLAHRRNFRMPLDLLERILRGARTAVRLNK